jgi:hypothetical protein
MVQGWSSYKRWRDDELPALSDKQRLSARGWERRRRLCWWLPFLQHRACWSPALTLREKRIGCKAGDEQ